VCTTCCGGSDPRFTICPSCRDVCRQLGGILFPVVPIALTTVDRPLHRALCRYKTNCPSAPVDARRLSGIWSAFVENHMECVAPAGIDTVLVVPSLGGRHPIRHPLADLLVRAGGLPEPADLLLPGPTAIGHRHASATAVRVSTSLRGRRVLLVDDTYTTGAHLQSAAVAVRDAGAVSVHPVVFGRFVRGGWPPARRILEWARSHPWDAGRCIRCPPTADGHRGVDGSLESTAAGPGGAAPLHSTVSAASISSREIPSRNRIASR
jgi:hypothetical protein